MSDIFDYVTKCPSCNGAGKYEQRYCDMPVPLSGPCQMCGKNSKYGRPGPGYVYKYSAEPVTHSVVAQIESLKRRAS